MARSIVNKVNVEAPDSDYPYGRIKNNTGTNNGTPVNENTYGDFHQFFAKMFAESGLVYNELPDNDYSGFQFFEALIQVIKDTRTRFWDAQKITTGFNPNNGIETVVFSFNASCDMIDFFMSTQNLMTISGAPNAGTVTWRLKVNGVTKDTVGHQIIPEAAGYNICDNKILICPDPIVKTDLIELTMETASTSNPYLNLTELRVISSSDNASNF